nr:EOG090X04IO [Sida crystallina]
MDRISRKEKEWKEIIEKQKEQLALYEKKLRDVIQAYKGVLKEKEALEASLNALTEIKTFGDAKVGNNLTASCAAPAPSDEVGESSSEPSTLSQSVDQPALSEEVDHLRTQVATLSSSLATITAEKSRSEANFQRDRKKLLQEKDDLEKSLAAACSQADSTSQLMKQQLSEASSQLSSERSERGKEMAKYQVTLRDLQKSIAEEKQRRENLEIEVNTKNSRLMQTSQVSSQLEMAERKLKDLSNELEATKMKLRSAEQKLEQPSPLLVQLQNEMADMRMQHRLAIQREQQSAAEAEEVARQLSAAHEKRVDELEASLALLSQTVGSYDRLRQQDLAQVAKLKEQLLSLQIEGNATSNLEEEEYDVEKLIDKMRSLKCRLLDCAARSKQTVDISGMLEVHGFSSPSGNHDACNAELQQLRQQLEWHQRQRDDRNQSSSNRNVDGEEVHRLRVQVEFLRSELDHAEQRSKKEVEAVEHCFAAERSSWKEELAQAERSFRVRLGDLEQQMQKQRERSLTLLQEKDDELSCLKEVLNMKNTAPMAPPAKHSPREDGEDAWPESLAPLGSMTLGATASGGQILHYHEELARKEIEIQTLRRAKNQLEGTLRDLQMAAVDIDYKAAEERHRLREEIGRLERNRSREGANLEYLKNVILEFFLRSDSSSQSHMFNAIAAILHFSPREIQRVRQQHPKWKSIVGVAGGLPPSLPPSPL